MICNYENIEQVANNWYTDTLILEKHIALPVKLDPVLVKCKLTLIVMKKAIPKANLKCSKNLSDTTVR